VHRAFYRALATYFGPNIPWHFMNYGFDSEHFREHPLPLRPEDTMDRFGIQLYDHLLSSLSIAGTTVLDVGCGRGGGAAYVASYLGPRRVVGIDRCHNSVRICSANHNRNVEFLTGDAQHLPFGDASFDVVVNVESSHGYPSMAAFLQEVHRILRPGGLLVFADLRWDHDGNGMTPARGLTLLKEQLCRSGLTVIHESDISAGVLRARAADQEGQRASIREHVPRGFRRAFAELAGLPGTTMYRRLEERRLVYWSSVLRKPPTGI
jgi:SAM-dependent methyltransferase